MNPDQLTELVQNDVVRGRLAKYLVRECFRAGEFENFHSRSTELDNDTVREIMTDAVNRLDRLLAAILANGEIVDALKEFDPVPNWNDPDWQERIDLDELNQREKIIKNLKARFK
jgi:hypothetical protein